MKIKNDTAVIYCRVSTAKQWSNWDSLQNQERVCRAYCKTHNIRVLWAYKEQFTWKSTQRPIFNECINNAIENKVHFFIVFDIDRFSREWYGKYTEIKDKLSNKWIKLKDSKNIIWDEKLVVQNDVIDMSQYKWNKENPTEMSEMVYSAQAKIEWNKIVQRTISKEIQLEQLGYQVRQSNYWYINKKIHTSEWKRTIQEKHPIEWEHIIQLFNLKAEWIKSDEDIIKEINLLWYKSRKNKALNIKQLHIYIKKPVYAGLISTKWTGNKIVKTPYEWLINIHTWNKANNWKIKIEVSNLWEYSLINKNKKNIDILDIKRRKKFDPNLKFRNLINSSLLEWQALSWSFSNPNRKNPTWYYHPIRKKWCIWENIKKEVLEENFYAFIKELEINDIIKTIFTDRLWMIFEQNKWLIQEKTKLLKNELNSVIESINDLESKILNIDISLTRVMQTIEKEIEVLEIKKDRIESKIESYTKANYDNIEQFKDFSLYLIEHIAEIMEQSQNYEELALLFKFIFKETPKYDEIINRTVPIYPLFSLNSKKELSNIENSSLNLKWQAH